MFDKYYSIRPITSDQLFILSCPTTSDQFSFLAKKNFNISYFITQCSWNEGSTIKLILSLSLKIMNT